MDKRVAVLLTEEEWNFIQLGLKDLAKVLDEDPTDDEEIIEMNVANMAENQRLAQEILNQAFGGK